MHKLTTKQRWQTMEREVNQITDRLGKRVDTGIKHTVTLLRLFQLPTSGSCQGHLKWGLPYPWVDINEPEPSRWKTNRKIKSVWGKRNLNHAKNLLQLLTEFYEQQDSPLDAHLILDLCNFAGFRLQSLGANINPIWTKQQKQQKLALYQKEMRDFTVFLKQKYLSSC